jgi:hypothetical protein
VVGDLTTCRMRFAATAAHLRDTAAAATALRDQMPISA